MKGLSLDGYSLTRCRSGWSYTLVRAECGVVESYLKKSVMAGKARKASACIGF